MKCLSGTADLFRLMISLKLSTDAIYVLHVLFLVFSMIINTIHTIHLILVLILIFRS